MSREENLREAAKFNSLFNEYGFAVLENFLLDEECDELKQAGDLLTQTLDVGEHKSVFSTLEDNKKHIQDKYFLESNDKIRPFFEEEALDSDGNLKVPQKVSLNKVGHALHLLHPIFRCYTYCFRVKSLCKTLGLIEPAVVQSMYIYKNPGVGGPVVAHQDATYLYTEPKPPIGFWIALEDACLDNGCLWIARGSHKSGVHRRMVRNDDPSSEDLLKYDKPAPVYPQSIFRPVPVRKGTCIILHGLVVHKSSANKSEKSRAAYTFHVIEKHENNYSSDNWLQEGEMAPFVNLYKTSQIKGSNCENKEQ